MKFRASVHKLQLASCNVGGATRKPLAVFSCVVKVKGR